MPVEILYEDKRLWLCVKPAGVSSEETEQQDGMPDRLRSLGGGYVGTGPAETLADENESEGTCPRDSQNCIAKCIAFCNAFFIIYVGGVKCTSILR